MSESKTTPMTPPLIDRLAMKLRECAEDIAAEVHARYEGTLQYPVQQRRRDRDMNIVKEAQALIEEWGKTQ